ncbi:metallophosphoesterase [Terriglobus albidus]|uniref:metallophosphoesterase n=1 Tax=Terriglobus albidus TaxID=1592106 RepID=UPI0021DFE73C|nr:metallophosphoesterase [Terriglobus albidus]
MRHPSRPEIDREILEKLELRLGKVHARLRLGIEKDHEAIFGHGLNFFHPENWYSLHSLFKAVLKGTGLYARGHRNAQRIHLRNNPVLLERLPSLFDGYSVLHISDLHADLSPEPMKRLAEVVPDLHYDLCVLTGDFRGQTFGSFDVALEILQNVRSHLKGPVYAVLGNHDSVRMLPAIEEMGIRMLMNETVVITRGDQEIYLSGVDDAHYYRADNVHQAAGTIPSGAISILLSHTPEIYRQAAHAGYSLMLSGHTHGGQVCLPGPTPITLDAKLPRAMGAGAWTYGPLIGYTSVGVGCSIAPIRFNCFPEITIHRLIRAESPAWFS